MADRRERLSAIGYNARQIDEELQRSDLADRWHGSVRTIQDIAQRLQSEGGSEWLLENSDPDDASLVLPVLAAVLEQSDGRVRGFSQDVGDWIARVRRAQPDIDPMNAWLFGVRYAAQTSPHQRHELDVALALGVWRDHERLVEANKRGWWHP